MKKTVLIVAGVVSVCAGLYCGAHLLAQPPASGKEQQSATVSPGTALVNLHAVLKGYKKTKQYDKEVEDLVGPMRKQGEEIKNKIAELTKAMQNQQDKEDLEKAISKQKLLLKGLESKAAKEVGMMRERQLVQLYKEIEEAVTRVAMVKGFTLVLQYSEPEAAERYTAKNIQRKLAGTSQTGGLTPIYHHPGLEISAAVIANLNASFKQAQQAGPG